MLDGRIKTIVMLGIFPPLLVAGFYFTDVWRGLKGIRGGQKDAAFYTVQMWRTGKILTGRWWRQTDPLGETQPYPPDTLRLPHLHEGVDLQVLSILTSTFFRDVSGISELSFGQNAKNTWYNNAYSAPIINFTLLSILVLLVNGWVAGGMVFYYTHRVTWSLLSQVLILLNWTTIHQFNSHLHWYKHFWVLAVILASYSFWVDPNRRKAIWLGVLLALLIQGSWYFSFFLFLALGMAIITQFLRAQVRKTHLVHGWLVGLIAVFLGGLLTLPYWVQRNHSQDQFSHRDLRDLLWLSSELCHYVLPKWSETGELYHQARVRYSPLAADIEVWHYPGILVLVTLLGYGIFRLRTRQVTDLGQGRIDYLVFLSVLLVGISLSGGISIILYKWVPQFRIYGRAGVVAVGIWSLVVPLILSRFSDRYLPGKWRVWFAVCCLIPALWDGWRAREALRLPDAKATLNIPGWVPWLAEQPSQVRTAIFPVVPEDYEQAYWWIFHRHEVLNNCDIRFFEQDVLSSGAKTGDAITQEMVDLLKRKGYSLIILRDRLWEKHPWMESTDSLIAVKETDSWRVYRIAE